MVINKTKTGVKITLIDHKQQIIKLWHLTARVVLFIALVTFKISGIAQVSTSIINYGNYHAVIYYCKPHDRNEEDTRSQPTVFMDSDNQQIIDTVKMMACNTIFFSVSTLNANQTPDLNNLGINPYVHTNGVRYLDKMVDFLDKCANQSIKVFALTLDEAAYVLTANHQTALNKLDKITFYQYHVRSDPQNTSFKTKKAHFHGVVTNLEAWAEGTGWQDICNSSNHTLNNNILGQYLGLIPLLYNKLDNDLFFNPPTSLPPYQSLDGLFLGTVHWFWHYYSMLNPLTFPNGNFSLYAGTHDGQHYFDIILPETYCPHTGNTCIGLPCLVDDCDQCHSGDYRNCESIGKCWQWFEKHFILGLDPNYPANAIRPIDAAPMLYGHSAFMFDYLSELNRTRWYSGEITRCYRKGYHYKGSFIFNYKELRNRFDGRVPTLPVMECQAVPDDGISKIDVINGCIIQRNIKIYPNPAYSSLTIDGLKQGDKCYLYDDHLVLRMTTDMEIIDVSVLEAGSYYLVIKDSKNDLVFKSKILIKGF